MAIASTDIKLRRAGASGLGGAISAVDVGSSMFDDVQIAESAEGSVEYRCAYVLNSHATLTLSSAVLWLTADTPSPSTVVEVGLGTSGIGGTEQAIASETTAPAGVTFAPAATKAAGVALGDLAPGQGRAVWFKRTVIAGAAARDADDPDTFTPYVEGVTPP
jgi:hypothetical protein